MDHRGRRVAAALLLVEELAQRGDGPEATVVVVLPDTGRNYLSKFLDDDWMAQRGFAGGAAPPRARFVDGLP